MMNNKTYIDILSQQAKIDGVPYEMALNNFCDFLLDLFSVEAFQGGLDVFKSWYQGHIHEKPKFGLLTTLWLSDVSRAVENGKWLDAFGVLYEDMYLTSGKASKTGQFFTPQSVSDLMSSIIGSSKNEAANVKIDGHKVNDCAAGSGRLLLSHFMKMSKENPLNGRLYN